MGVRSIKAGECYEVFQKQPSDRALGKLESGHGRSSGHGASDKEELGSKGLLAALG